MPDTRTDIVLRLVRGDFNRKLVLWTHVALGMAAGMIYLSRIDLTGFRYYRRGAGTGAIFLAAPALLPYLISGIYSRRFTSFNRVRVWAFAFILLFGAAIGALFYLNVIPVDPEDRRITLVGVLFAQALRYCTAAGLLLVDG